MRDERISEQQAMLQVRGVFPNAHLVEGGAGWIVVADARELSDQPGGYVGSTEQAWRNALSHVKRLHHEGRLPHVDTIARLTRERDGLRVGMERAREEADQAIAYQEFVAAPTLADARAEISKLYGVLRRVKDATGAIFGDLELANKQIDTAYNLARNALEQKTAK